LSALILISLRLGVGVPVVVIVVVVIAVAFVVVVVVIAVIPVSIAIQLAGRGTHNQARHADDDGGDEEATLHDTNPFLLQSQVSLFPCKPSLVSAQLAGMHHHPIPVGGFEAFIP
jgi:hypothetical protein